MLIIIWLLKIEVWKKDLFELESHGLQCVILKYVRSFKIKPPAVSFFHSLPFLSSFSHPQPRAVMHCHSFISSPHNFSCPFEYLGIQVSIHLSAPFS